MLTALMMVLTVSPAGARQRDNTTTPVYSCHMSAASCQRLAELIATQEYIGEAVEPQGYTQARPYEIYQLPDPRPFGEYPTEKSSER